MCMVKKLKTHDFEKQYFIFSIRLRQAIKIEISFTD